MEEQDRPYDPDVAKDAAVAFMVVDAEDPQARPGFYAFAARRTPVLPLTSALWVCFGLAFDPTIGADDYPPPRRRNG